MSKTLQEILSFNKPNSWESDELLASQEIKILVLEKFRECLEQEDTLVDTTAKFIQRIKEL